MRVAGNFVNFTLVIFRIIVPQLVSNEKSFPNYMYIDRLHVLDFVILTLSCFKFYQKIFIKRLFPKWSYVSLGSVCFV